MVETKTLETGHRIGRTTRRAALALFLLVGSAEVALALGDPVQLPPGARGETDGKDAKGIPTLRNGPTPPPA